MKNLKIYNIKENEEYKLSREYPKWLSFGCALGAIGGGVAIITNVALGNPMTFKQLVRDLSTCVGFGAITTGVVYPMLHPVLKKILNEKQRDNQENDNDKSMVLKKNR